MPVVPWEGAPAASPPINCQNFYHTVLTFEHSVCIGLNVTTTTKNGRQLFVEEKCTLGEKSACPRPEKILPTPVRKGPPPYVGIGPQMVNPALPPSCINSSPVTTNIAEVNTSLSDLSWTMSRVPVKIHLVSGVPTPLGHVLSSRRP